MLDIAGQCWSVLSRLPGQRGLAGTCSSSSVPPRGCLSSRPGWLPLAQLCSHCSSEESVGTGLALPTLQDKAGPASMQVSGGPRQQKGTPRLTFEALAQSSRLVANIPVHAQLSGWHEGVPGPDPLGMSWLSAETEPIPAALMPLALSVWTQPLLPQGHRQPGSELGQGAGLPATCWHGHSSYGKFRGLGGGGRGLGALVFH